MSDAAPAASPTPFRVASAVRDLGGGRFAADLHPQWTIGGKPNGGYLLAMLARTAVASVAHDDVLAASAHYLHAPSPGPVELRAEVLREGRSADQVRVGLVQDGRPCVEALLTVGGLDPAARPYWSGGVPASGLSPDGRPAPTDSVRVPGRTPTGVPVSIMDEVDLHLDPDVTGFAAGRPSGRGVLRGWLTLPEDEPFDPIALLYAVDALPPATFEVELTGWVPTLELTAYVRARPEPGPLRVVQQANLIDGQRVDEQCWVWDRGGRVVAHAVQLAGIRLG